MRKHFMKFIAGAAVGAGIGVAAGRYFSSEEGKKKKEKMKKMMGDFCSFANSKVKMMKNMGKSRYEQVITGAAEEYGKMKKLSEEAVEELAEKTLAMWEGFIESNAAKEKEA